MPRHFGFSDTEGSLQGQVHSHRMIPECHLQGSSSHQWKRTDRDHYRWCQVCYSVVSNVWTPRRSVPQASIRLCLALGVCVYHIYLWCLFSLLLLFSNCRNCTPICCQDTGLCVQLSTALTRGGDQVGTINLHHSMGPSLWARQLMLCYYHGQQTHDCSVLMHVKCIKYISCIVKIVKFCYASALAHTQFFSLQKVLDVGHINTSLSTSKTFHVQHVQQCSCSFVLFTVRCVI